MSITPQRFGSVIRLRPEKEQEYIALHADAWPAILQRISDSNIRNFSIYLHDGLLFSYSEYHGDDYEADMAAIAAHPETNEWWKLTDPCQQRLDTAAPGEHWASMREVFHLD